MNIKTSELTGVALDWAVAKCEGVEVTSDKAYPYNKVIGFVLNSGEFFHPSTDWAVGGPIIERELYKVTQNMGGTWSAQIKYKASYYSPTYDCDIGCDVYVNSHGNTPLEAAMRCYVAHKLGDEIEIEIERL